MPQGLQSIDFLIGKWSLRYTLFSDGRPKPDGKGLGEIQKTLDGKFITFDYQAELSTGIFKAHAIFAWDSEKDLFRYWWFENSGQVQQAEGRMKDESTLVLQWQNIPCTQTFRETSETIVVLEMAYQGKPALEVSLTRNH